MFLLDTHIHIQMGSIVLTLWEMSMPEKIIYELYIYLWIYIIMENFVNLNDPEKTVNQTITNFSVVWMYFMWKIFQRKKTLLHFNIRCIFDSVWAEEREGFQSTDTWFKGIVSQKFTMLLLVPLVFCLKHFLKYQSFHVEFSMLRFSASIFC
jgi:hypothetical protein